MGHIHWACSVKRCDQGEDLEINVLKNSMEPVWEWGMLSGNQPGHCRDTTGDFWRMR